MTYEELIAKQCVELESLKWTIYTMQKELREIGGMADRLCEDRYGDSSELTPHENGLLFQIQRIAGRYREATNDQL